MTYRALVCLLLAHAAVARLRFVPHIGKLIDPPLQVLIRDGRIDRRNVRRCGLTVADMDAVLRQHGFLSADRVRLAIFEAKGAISVLPVEEGRTVNISSKEGRHGIGMAARPLGRRGGG